jgi:hypothetical protein
MKRVLAAIAAVLIIGAIGYTAGGASADGGATAQRSTGLIAEGHYEGRDALDNHIRFNYSHQYGMTHFRVEHEGNVKAHVHNASWSMPCIPNSQFISSHGEWITTHMVKGGWQHGCGNSHHFDAHWVSSHPQ